MKVGQLVDGRFLVVARLGDLMERTERLDGLANDVEALKAMIDERRAMSQTPVRAKVRS